MGGWIVIDFHRRRERHVIDAEGKVSAAFPGVDPKTHTAEVLAAL